MTGAFSEILKTATVTLTIILKKILLTVSLPLDEWFTVSGELLMFSHPSWMRFRVQQVNKEAMDETLTDRMFWKLNMFENVGVLHCLDLMVSWRRCIYSGHYNHRGPVYHLRQFKNATHSSCPLCSNEMLFNIPPGKEFTAFMENPTPNLPNPALWKNKAA